MIDFKNRKIYGKSGKVYDIKSSVSVGRMSEYDIRGSLLALNTDFNTLASRHQKIRWHLIHGDLNAQGNIYNALLELDAIDSGMKRYGENQRSAVIEFCALFCIEEGEDVSTFDEDMFRRKYEDWAHIDSPDFFYLAGMSIPAFRENIIKALNLNQS